MALKNLPSSGLLSLISEKVVVSHAVTCPPSAPMCPVLCLLSSPHLLCCRQSPRRHIQTRDAADGEQYQVVHTDSTNILIRWVSSAGFRPAHPPRCSCGNLEKQATTLNVQRGAPR